MTPLSGSPTEVLKYLVNHIVLPPKLPQQDDRSAVLDVPLLDLTIYALEDLRAQVGKAYDSDVAAAIATIQNLQLCRDAGGNISSESLQLLLEKFVHSDYIGLIPLEVTQQNAGILFSRCDDKLKFECFELSPTNKAAMGTKGRLKRVLPALAAEIPIIRLKDKGLIVSLAHTISTLSFQRVPGMQPEVRKQRQLHEEDRDTTSPAMITEFFWNIIAANGKPTSTKRIIKHTREDVIWHDCLSPWRRSALWLMIRATIQLMFTRNGRDGQACDSLYKVFMIQLLSRLLKMVGVAASSGTNFDHLCLMVIKHDS